MADYTLEPITENEDKGQGYSLEPIDDKSALSRSAIIAHNVDSDKYAANRKAMTDKGIPESFASPANKPPSMDGMLSTIKDFLGLSGKTAEHMSDPDFAKVAKDDHPALTKFEDIWNQGKEFISNFGIATPEQQKKAQELNKSSFETPTALVSGVIAWGAGLAGQAVSRFAGLATLDDERGTPEYAKKIRTTTQEAGTYQPKTKESQDEMKIIGPLMSLPAILGNILENDPATSAKFGEGLPLGIDEISSAVASELQRVGTPIRESFEMFGINGTVQDISQAVLEILGYEKAGKGKEVVSQIAANHLSDIVKTAKESKLKARDPEQFKSFVQDVAGDSTVQVPLKIVNDILERGKLNPNDLSDPYGYWQTYFDDIIQDGNADTKHILSMSDVATLSDNITPEHIKDMSVEGIPSEGDNAVAGANSKEAEANKAIPDQPAANVEGKQPWEMTRDEFFNKTKADMAEVFTPEFLRAMDKQYADRGGSKAHIEYTENSIRQGHKDYVENALKEGKPVPESVLKDYPDLQKAQEGKGKGLSAEMKGADETSKPLSEQTPDKTGDMFGNEQGKIDLEPAIQSAREALQKIREGNEASKYGEALRTFYTGARDYRIAETNQLRDGLKKIIPDFKDQEALSLLRDFKGKEADLAKRRDEYEKAGDKKIVSIIDRALNPSKELLKADKKMTDYFSKHLEEGKKLGFLDSSITNEQYITHLLEPEEKVGNGKGGMGGGKIGRNFQFAKARKYENILDAYDNPGVKVKTMNALDAMTIYGDKHATAAATKLLTNELKNTEMGKWGFRTSDKIPREWVELSPGRELFRNRIPYIDKETGEAAIATQNLYVPEKVADALKPIIDPASIANVPGFKKGRMYQAYIKGVELGLSVFHMKALNVTALNNAKLTSMVKSYVSDMESPEFTTEEKDLIKDGLTTSILGRTIEAYKAAQPSTFPTRMDMIRNLPGIKQADKAAQFLTHETFDVIQRKFKVMDASLQVSQWMAKHPAADALSLTEARRAICKEVNAAYGGLHWENMGVNKNTLEISRALMLAPDWTFSNVVNAKYAFEGGPGGKAARKFWIKSAVTGALLTQAMSMAVSGKWSNHATEVYLGKDKNGEDTYSNMFFAGAPKDATTLFENIRQFGAIEGLAHSMASKAGPLARTGMELATNKDWMGKDITTKGAGFGKNTLRAGEEIASNLAPIPFSVSNIAKMLTDPKYGEWDYFSVLGGTPPRHMSDARENIYDLERKNDKDQMEASKMKSTIVDAFRKNKPLSSDQRKSYDAMTEIQKKNIDKEADMTPLQVAFSHLPPAKVEQVWSKLSAKEKNELQDIYDKKLDNSENKE